MEYLISIVVPVYNVELYVRECIESIQAQTYKNLEIILVDDGSTDQSGSICDEYAEKDDRIIVIHKKNGGVTSARKEGVAIANGKYIGFVDADDWVEPAMYEHMLNIMLDTNADFVDSGYIQDIDATSFPLREDCSDLNITEYNRSEIIYRYISGNSYNDKVILTLYWSKLFQADFIKKNILLIEDEVKIAEDVINILYMIFNCNKIAFTNQYYYHYRYREDSASRPYHLSQTILDHIITLKSFYKCLNTCTFEPKYKMVAIHRVLSWIVGQAEHKWISSGEDIYQDKSELYMYPDEMLLKDKKIILYGASEFGKHYYKRYNNEDICKIVCWVDKHYKNMTYYPRQIESPDHILNYDFDYVLIAVYKQGLADQIRNDLIEKGIPEEKILWKVPKLDLDWLL